MAPLVALLSQDVRHWLASHHKVFTNERDLQVRLALFLEQTRHYKLVDTEYRIPLDELKAKGLSGGSHGTNSSNDNPDTFFPWGNDMSVDIVVEKNGFFACVELKYATRKIDSPEPIFGESKLTAVSILKNQAASNLTMYNYWKDVRRIELLTSLYHKVVGGVALLVCNSHDYWSEPRDDAKYKAFSMHEDNVVGPGLLSWAPGVSESIINTHPDFQLMHAYPCRWEECIMPVTSIYGEPFRFMLTQISKT